MAGALLGKGGLLPEENGKNDAVTLWFVQVEVSHSEANHWWRAGMFLFLWYVL